MLTSIRALAVGVVLSACATAARTDEKETAENPYYKHWSRSKVGASVELKETTKSPGAKGEPGDEDVKLITHKLIELTPEKAVVETVVTEGEIFGFVQSAPTRHIYPARMSKDVLEELLRESGAKGTPSTVKVGNKELKAVLLTGTMKKGEDDIEFKIWLTEEVPGAIARRVRTTKQKGELIAETTVEVVSYKKD